MDNIITWADIALIKKTAKANKQAQPLLSHTQRLDAAAHDLYGVRHFHEFQTRYHAQIDAFARRDESGGAHYCKYCRFTFDGSYAPDVKTHRELHKRFEEAHTTLGYLPDGYQSREKTKRLGYDWMLSPNKHTQREGALAVLLAQFERSLESAIEAGTWPKHPYFPEYVSFIIGQANNIPEAIRAGLEIEFGRVDVIPAGQSSWSSRFATPARTTAKAEILVRSNDLRTSIIEATSNFDKADTLA
ncbi:hypothetical protein V0R37_15110 [Pollutimonas sp. H1-120]|uniref:hypothetical protein n=1 Tax=Pollutimonas sp. H1-120 TaxID=3148824 RepID=UPI003B52D6ED